MTFSIQGKSRGIEPLEGLNILTKIFKVNDIENWEMEDNFKNAVNIFNKYAEAYEEKYMDVSLYKRSLDELIDFLPRKASVLDIGCGPGNISSYLLKQLPELRVTCADGAEKMLEIAARNNPRATFKILDIRKVKTIGEKFNAVICGFCLPYLSREETEVLLKDIYSILTKNGIFYLSTMEDSYSHSGYQKSSSGEDRLFIYYYEAEYLKDFLQEKGFKIVYEELVTQPEDQRSSGQDIILIAEK